MSTRRFASLCVASVAGVCAGIGLERHRGAAFRQLMVVEAASPIAGDIDKRAGDSTQPGLQHKFHSQRVSKIMEHGYPSLDTIRTYDNFVLSYDRRNRTANWVFEHLSPELLKPQNPAVADRSKCEFKEDVSVHEYWRARNDDYKSSGFDRGHLAAAGNHKLEQRHVDQTFFLSNIAPQVGKGFNRDAWNNLERYVRFRAQRCANLWVCTGPVYLPRSAADGKNYVKFEVIGKSHVSVPTHFFKVLLVESKDGSLDIEAYLMPNKAIDANLPLMAFQVPIDSIERAAGLLFFHQVPKNKLKRINGHNPVLDQFMSTQIHAPEYLR